MKFFEVILSFCLIGLTISHPFNESIEIDESEYGLKIQPRTFDLKIQQDAFLTTPQLLKKYDYPAEIHTVQTADGYILEMHRIPRPGGIPVFLVHDLSTSSAAWVIMGPHSAFAYYLSDLGYDVWLGNTRGTPYSRKHIILDPNSKQFWDFTFHELGMFDLPTMIDYIIEKTDYEKIHYIGHSQGTTSFFVMCSQRPNYCNKIISMQAMSPMAFVNHVKSPIIRIIAPFVSQWNWISKFIGANEFLPSSDLFKMGGQILCRKEAIAQVICNNIIFLVTGYDSQQLNKTMLPAILGHIPASAATKQYTHYGQLVNSGKFRMFDHGWFKNHNLYGQISPPSYDLSKVTAPVYLLYSMNDWLSDVKDVSKLQSLLPNVIKSYIVPEPRFNHLDFIIGMNSRQMVQEQVVMNMKQAENRTCCS